MRVIYGLVIIYPNTSKGYPIYLEDVIDIKNSPTYTTFTSKNEDRLTINWNNVSSVRYQKHGKAPSTDYSL